MQLQLIELDKEEVNIEEEAKSDEEGSPHISLHAIEGMEGTTTMRIQGQVGRKMLQILIDNGSTHDFLDYALAKRLGWKANGDELSAVEVAGGKRSKVYGMWKNFKWRMQDEDFTSDLRVMELHTYDMVLGLKWLKSIKNAFWDYDALVVYFSYNGKMLTSTQATK